MLMVMWCNYYNCVGKAQMNTGCDHEAITEAEQLMEQTFCETSENK